MMSVREDEKEAIENWSERHPDVEVGIDEGELHADTVAKVKGYDGVVIQQRSLVEDEVYAELKNLGLKQISTRTAGYGVIVIVAMFIKDKLIFLYIFTNLVLIKLIPMHTVHGF